LIDATSESQGNISRAELVGEARFVDYYAAAPETLAFQHPRPLHLRQVRIRQFKGIEDLTLTFLEKQVSEGATSCLMLLGENSTGKSSSL
jgi:hypothetical protein